MSTSAELSFAAGCAVGAQHLLRDTRETSPLYEERRTQYIAALDRLEKAVRAELDQQRKLYWEQYGVTPG